MTDQWEGCPQLVPAAGSSGATRALDPFWRGRARACERCPDGPRGTGRAAISKLSEPEESRGKKKSGDKEPPAHGQGRTFGRTLLQVVKWGFTMATARHRRSQVQRHQRHQELLEKGRKSLRGRRSV